MRAGMIHFFALQHCPHRVCEGRLSEPRATTPAAGIIGDRDLNPSAIRSRISSFSERVMRRAVCLKNDRREFPLACNGGCSGVHVEFPEDVLEVRSDRRA